MGKRFLGVFAALCITFVGGGVVSTSYAASPCYGDMKYKVSGTSADEDEIEFWMYFNKKGKLEVLDENDDPLDIGAELGGDNCNSIKKTLKIKKNTWVCKYKCNEGVRAEINLKFSGSDCDTLTGFISVGDTKYTLNGEWEE